MCWQAEHDKIRENKAPGEKLTWEEYKSMVFTQHVRKLNYMKLSFLWFFGLANIKNMHVGLWTATLNPIVDGFFDLQVITETVRMSTPLNLLMREAKEDVKISSKCRNSS